MFLRRNFWGVAVVFGVSILGALWTHAQIYNQLLLFCVFICAFSFIWSWLVSRSISVRRYVRGVQAQLGQVLTEQFVVSNSSRLICLSVEIRDETLLPNSGGSRVMSWIGGHETHTYSAYTLLTQRGDFKLGPTSVYIGDPFGLFAFKKTFENDQSLLVVPFLVDIEKFSAPAGLLPGGRALRRKTLEVTPYAAGVREYDRGDSLNRIHWPTTARREKLMVKEFEQDPQADIYIFLDSQDGIQYSMPEEVQFSHDKYEDFWQFGKRYVVKLPPSTFEYCISAAGSVARYFIRHGQALGFASAGQQYVSLSAERGERQFNKILEMLGLLRCEGTMSISALIELEATRLPRGSTVVLVTTNWRSTLITAVDGLIFRNLRPVVILVDPGSFGGYSEINTTTTELSQRNVQMILIKNGDDLSTVFHKGFFK
jgi:uncharacterized protein (DUF58 family)